MRRCSMTSGSLARTYSFRRAEPSATGREVGWSCWHTSSCPPRSRADCHQAPDHRIRVVGHHQFGYRYRSNRPGTPECRCRPGARTSRSVATVSRRLRVPGPPQARAVWRSASCDPPDRRTPRCESVPTAEAGSAPQVPLVLRRGHTQAPLEVPVQVALVVEPDGDRRVGDRFALLEQASRETHPVRDL